MTKLEETRRELADLMPALSERYHVSRMAIYGCGKGDFSRDDIDLLVEFGNAKSFGFANLGEELERLLRRRVHLVATAGENQRYMERVRKDLVFV